MKIICCVIAILLFALPFSGCASAQMDNWEPPTNESTVAHTHKYTETITAPTCAEKGYTTFTCACGRTYTRNETQAIGHKWSNWETTIEPTVECTGISERKCATCSVKEQKSIAKLDLGITNPILVDENDVVFQITGITQNKDSWEISYLLENNSSQNVSLYGSTCIINGVCVQYTIWIESASGKKAVGNWIFNKNDLQELGITVIADMRFPDAHISDSESNEKIFDCPLAFSTTIADAYQQSVDDSGQKLYDKDGITLIAKGITDELFGTALVILVKNDTDNLFYPQGDNISINGYMVSTSYSRQDVYPGTVRYCYVYLESMFDSSALDAVGGVNNIREIAFTVAIMNGKTTKPVMQTDELVYIHN